MADIKKILSIIIMTSLVSVFAQSVAIVFSGSNNGYYRDCG